MTVEVRGNYPKFKQNLAEKENFDSSKISETQPLLGKFRLKVARFQKLTTMIGHQVTKYESGNKKTSQKAVFSR